MSLLDIWGYICVVIISAYVLRVPYHMAELYLVRLDNLWLKEEAYNKKLRRELK